MKVKSLYIGGQLWTIYLTGKRSKYLKGGKVGRCVYEKCRIYLLKGQDPQALEDALLHELFHALLYVTGGEAAYGRDPEKEETLVSAITPAFHRLLKDLGFTFPLLS